MSKFEATNKNDEQTVQLYEIYEPNQEPEVLIQRNMDDIFHQEVEIVEDGAQEKSENDE